MQQIINVDTQSQDSKYRQIIDSVKESIVKGKIALGDKMPSINDVCKKWGLSRDTVVHAYNELKAQGIISSAPGKGFYISSTDIRLTNNIFVLFDEFNSFKEVLYNSFLENLPADCHVDIYFHHFNRKVFDKLVEEARGKFTTFVIMPAKFKDTLPLLESLRGRVIILDQLPPDLTGHFPAIYQNFEEDTFQALMAGKDKIDKYHSLIMVYPGGKEPEGQYQGFLKFCHHTGKPHELIHTLENRKISEGEMYLVIWDRDLVWLMKEARKKGLEPGKDIGIISYNDTALKEVVGNGVTTISTDFRQMGARLAAMVNEDDDGQIENASMLIARGTL